MTTLNTPVLPHASAETEAEHSNARWADWQRRGDVKDLARNRRVWIIGSVVAAGVVAWLVAALA